MGIAENIEQVRNKISQAAESAGRNPQEIQLIAVSKRQPISAINAAIARGQYHFGENYLQEAQEKIMSLDTEHHPVKWHFIGQVQSNKTKTIAELFDLVETIDRFKIANKLNSHLEALGRRTEVLVQVNIGGEPQKGGVAPEKAAELLQQLKQCAQIDVAGLMAMPPYFADPEQARPYFREMRLLRDELMREKLFPGRDTVELSMGMSGDFEVAIEEGATMVRVGTAIFGERQ